MKALVFLTLFLAVGSAAAQDEKPRQAGGLPDPANLPTLPEKKDKGDPVGDPHIKFVVDEEFTKEHEHDRPPSAPFSVLVPDEENVYVIAGGKKSGAPELLRISVTDKDRKALEIIRFAHLTIPMLETMEDRLKVCGVLLRERVLPSIERGYEDEIIMDVYRTKVSGFEAVVLHSQMVDPKTSTGYAVKIVGILKPGEPGGVMMFTMANSAESAVHETTDLESKGYGQRILHSLDFID